MNMKCRECPDYTKCVKESNLAIKRKNFPKAKTEKVKTNADRIRSMTDEALATWINDTGVICNLCAYQKECDVPCGRETCIDGIVKWLQQPAEEVLMDG